MSKEKSTKKPKAGSLVRCLITVMDVTEGKTYEIADSEEDLEGVSVWDNVDETWYLLPDEFEVLTESGESSSLIEQEHDGMEIVG